MAAPSRRTWRQLISLATGAAALSVGAGAALGDGGGVGTPRPPQVRDVQCLERCADIRAATTGSRILVSGSELENVDEVIFAGGETVAPLSAAPSAVEARVPAGAGTGRVRVAAYGSVAESEQELRIVPEHAIPEAGEFELRSAQATPRKTFYDGARRPRLTYLFHGREATDVRIEVVSRRTGELVASFVDEDAKPNARNVASWDGRGVSGALAANGEYKFRVGSLSGGGAKATEKTGFRFYRFRFPVPGRHAYGDGFGAGRNHQGQDVFARCGSKLVAARGGRVQWNRTHSAAGNYLVIDGKGTPIDFMYGHLRRRSPLRQGARVRTGEVIGQVGDSGNASGCHLHFELWSGPGWYEGGEALPSVTRQLRTWDAWS